MERAGDIAGPDETRASLPAMARFLWPNFRPYRIQLLLIAGGVLLEMAFSAAFPLSLKVLIDNALIGRNYHLLLVILAVLGVGVVVVSLAGLGRDYIYARVSSSALGNLRFVMFNHLQWLSMDFFAWARGGGILARFSGDLATVENVLAMILPWGVLPSLDVLANCVILFALDYRLALIAMLVWPFSLLGPRYLTPRAIRSSSLKKESESALLSSVQESVLAQPVIKAYGLELPLLADFYTLNSGIFRNAVRLNFLSAMVERSAGVSILMLNVLIIGVGAQRVFRGHLSVGALVSFETVFLSLSYSLSYVTQYVPSLVQAFSCLDQIQRLMARCPQIVNSADAVDLPRLSREIAFNDVTFSYTGEDVNLRNLSLRIKRGESVAFVGASGSGKSTLLNLLLRFYDPQQGSISFDEHDLRTVTQRSLRSQVAVVFQENFLFDVSVRENIRMGDPRATDEEVIEAAKAAEIDEFIASLPQGYDTPAGERGSRFSGGQRQRIAIARALLRNPAILYLDEATSALDAASEAAINETLTRIGRGRTVISITHRLRSTVNADRIFVLDRGQLVESGTHDELLESGTFYRLLWEKQNQAAVETQIDERSIQPVA